MYFKIINTIHTFQLKALVNIRKENHQMSEKNFKKDHMYM